MLDCSVNVRECAQGRRSARSVSRLTRHREASPRRRETGSNLIAMHASDDDDLASRFTDRGMRNPAAGLHFAPPSFGSIT